MDRIFRREQTRIYKKSIHDKELSEYTIFKNSPIITGFFGWEIFAFDNLNELLIWYLRGDKLLREIPGLDESIKVKVRYVPVYFSKNTYFPNLDIELSSNGINKISVFLKKKKSTDDIGKREKSIIDTINRINKKHIMKKMLQQKKVKYYAIAFLDYNLEKIINHYT